MHKFPAFGFLISTINSFSGFALIQSMHIRAKSEVFVSFIQHTLITLFFPNLHAHLAHQLLYERSRCTELERELWILRRRHSKPLNNPLCFCGRISAIYYAIRYPFPLKKLKAHIGLSYRTISRYRALLKRGISFLIPKRFRRKKPRTPDTLNPPRMGYTRGEPCLGTLAYCISHLALRHIYLTLYCKKYTPKTKTISFRTTEREDK